MSKSRQKIRNAFREVHNNPPRAVQQTMHKKGATAANKQMTAIALSKARHRGARIPKK